MARGFLSGMIWGGIVSVLGAGVASVVADGPVRPDAGITAPLGADAPAAGEGSTAEAVTDADLVRGGDAPQVTSPEADDVADAPAAGYDSPTVPETGNADDLAGPAETSEAGSVAVGDVAPVQPGAPATAPSAPGSETELSISTEPAQPAAPSVPDTSGAFAPEEGAAPQTPGAETPGPDSAEAAAPPEPNVAVAPAEVEQDAPTEDVIAALPEAEATGRPTIGRPAGSLVDRTPDVPTAPQEGETQATDAPPIVAFAAPFENPDDKPLMSIVLIDAGIDLTGGPVGLAALQSFPYPLSFAVDASLSDAGKRMSEYRAQGFEVLALVDLPQGATAVDAEVTLSAAIDAVPEVVGVMEGPGTGIQGTRDASDQVAEALLASGHGLVLQSKGLNTAQKLAARAGVPTGLVFRDFDSADQTPTVIRRFLDQAAFRAGQEGGVIMVGRVRPDTISALLLWGLQDRAERVALAPVAAVLTTLTEEQ